MFHLSHFCLLSVISRNGIIVGFYLHFPLSKLKFHAKVMEYHKEDAINTGYLSYTFHRVNTKDTKDHSGVHQLITPYNNSSKETYLHLPFPSSHPNLLTEPT